MALLKTPKHVAVFFNSDGEEAGRTTFNPKRSHFNFDGRKYFVRLNQATRFKVSGVIQDTFYYDYPLNYPEPFIKTDEGFTFIMSAEDFRTIIDTEVAKDVNDVDNNSLLGNLSTKQIVIGIVVLLGGIYFVTSGGL